MDSERIKQQIRLWDAGAKTVEIISSGATNIVGLTETTAYRFPLTEDAITIQLYEAALYKQLGGRLDIDVPRLVKMYDNPKCIAITRLYGRHFSTSELASLPQADLQRIIRQLVAFSLALNKVVDVAAIKKLEDTYITNETHERSWHDYFAMHLEGAQFPQHPWLENLARSYYKKWFDTTRSSSLPKQVVHDELHDANLLFTGHQLSGIIDFGDTTVGTMAQELRQLLRISEDAVKMAIDEYEHAAGVVVELEEIRTWAVAQELASYCRWFARGQLDRPSFLRAQSYLRRWLPGFKDRS